MDLKDQFVQLIIESYLEIKLKGGERTRIKVKFKAKIYFKILLEQKRYQENQKVPHLFKKYKILSGKKLKRLITPQKQLKINSLMIELILIHRQLLWGRYKKKYHKKQRACLETYHCHIKKETRNLEG